MDKVKIFKLLSTLKAEVQCPICLSFIEDARQLECSHYFCAHCFEKVKSQCSVCPVCTEPIRKRAPVYKDKAIDGLSRFLNHSCQVIKEKYAFEVDQLCKKNKKQLQEIFDTAPQDIPTCINAIVPSASNETSTNNIRMPETNPEMVNTRIKIFNWLNKNEEKFNALTQNSPSLMNEHESEFEMPSISQLPKKKLHCKTRSQSLNEPAEQLLPPRKFRSLNELDDYNIEEVHSETLVQQVERKVIQDLLEDKCLANLEQLAKTSKEEFKFKKKSPTNKPEEKPANVSNTDSSSGWNRMKDVGRIITRKAPKKLKIHSHDKKGANKKSAKGKLRSDEGNRNKLKKEETRVHDMDDIEKVKKTTDIIFNPTTMENDFQKHMETVSKDVQKPSTSETSLNNNIPNKPDDDDVFLRATQITPDTMNQEKICHISPVLAALHPDNIATRLADNIRCCIASCSNLQNSLGPQLVDCFTSLLTYAEKLEGIRSSVRVEFGVQTSKNSGVHMGTQTVTIKRDCVGVQTVMKKLADKSLQVCRQQKDMEVQTAEVVCVKQGMPTLESEKGKTKEIIAKTEHVDSSVKNGRKDEILQINVMHQLNSSGEEKTINSIVSSNTKQLHISADSSKQNKSSNAGESVLICSLSGASSEQKKAKRQLTFEANTESRKFKRIRQPGSDSESDNENGQPSKKKFIKNNLSIQFIDTEVVEQEDSASDMDKLECDRYLLEVMKKYEPSPPKKKLKMSSKTDEPSPIDKEWQLKEKTNKSQIYTDESQHAFTEVMAKQDTLDKIDQEIMLYERNLKIDSSELDLVENTPAVVTDTKLSSKKQALHRPIQILSKGSVVVSTSNAKNDSGLFVTNVTSALNRAIEEQPVQTENGFDDVADILADLQQDQEFFNQDLEEKEIDGEVSSSIDLALNGACKEETNLEMNFQEPNAFEIEDDVEVEEKLGKIDFVAAENESDQNTKIKILQNILIKDPEAKEGGIEESNTSDEEIVETTPQKKKNNSNNRSFILEDLKNISNLSSSDFYLPPPPGFEDKTTTNNSPSPELLPESPVEQKENFPPRPKAICSLTPDRLSELIITPEENPVFTEKQLESPNNSMSFVTPSRLTIEKPNKSIISQATANNSKDIIFSPVTKSSLKIPQSKYTPLVSTSKALSKKSSLMTSTPNQKSILNYVVPSQDSPSTSSQKAKPCVTWSRILNRDLNIFIQLECKKLMSVSKVFNSDVTHLIVLVDDKGQILSHTAKILLAIAAGIWVVRYEWAEDCLKMNRIVPEEPYEALDTTGVPGPKISRTMRENKPLFASFKFYCAPPFKTVSRKDLESILKLSGAEIASDLGDLLNNDGKIHIILTESTESESTEQFEAWLEVYKAITVDVEWLTCCIGQHKLVSCRPFLISGHESTFCDLNYPATLMESVPLTLTETLL